MTSIPVSKGGPSTQQFGPHYSRGRIGGRMKLSYGFKLEQQNQGSFHGNSKATQRSTQKYQACRKRSTPEKDHCPPSQINAHSVGLAGS